MMKFQLRGELAPTRDYEVGSRRPRPGTDSPARPRIRARFVLALVCLGLFAALAPPAALANAQGGWVMSNTSLCPSGNCRSTRSDITRSNPTGWSVPSSTFGYEWIAAENTNASVCPYPSSAPGCIVQIGYAKYSSSGAPLDCSGSNDDTGGNVEILSYAIYNNNHFYCDLGQQISAGEEHTLKVARCNNSNSDWCTYVDGNQSQLYTSPGIGSTAPELAVVGEFGCDTCQGASTFIGSEWGAGTTSGADNWQAGDNNTWNTLHNGDAGKVNHPTNCNGGNDPKWIIDNVNTSSKWTIHWENGGVAC